MKKFDRTGAIIGYESGQLSDRDTLKLFSHLIKTGLLYKLQGYYGRTGEALIDDGFITRQGNLTDKGKSY